MAQPTAPVSMLTQEGLGMLVEGGLGEMCDDRMLRNIISSRQNPAIDPERGEHLDWTPASN